MNKETPLIALLPVLNAKEVDTDSAIVYLWLVYLAGEEGRWEFQYSSLATLTGLSAKRLSVIIARLENVDLLDVYRKNGKITVEPLDIPDRLSNSLDHNIALLEEKEKLAALQKKHFQI